MNDKFEGCGYKGVMGFECGKYCGTCDCIHYCESCQEKINQIDVSDFEIEILEKVYHIKSPFDKSEYENMIIGRKAIKLTKQRMQEKILNFIETESDKGNCAGGGFSAGICLSDLKKLLGDDNE